MSERREPGNNNRIDLYRHLLGKIQDQDQLSGAQGFIHHWDDPDATWDPGNSERLWDRIWLSPIIQELFFVIETMYGEDLQALEDLDAITDPTRCPESYLSLIAASFGYQLAEGITVEQKRAVLLGLIDIFKRRGTRVSYRAFYRITGFTLLDVYPLYKKEIHEVNNDYNRDRYRTTEVVEESIGPAGTSSYAGRLSQPSIRPGSVVFRVGLAAPAATDVFYRDAVTVIPASQADTITTGGIIGPPSAPAVLPDSFVNYSTGEFRLNLAVATADPVFVTYEHIDEEWPYFAARIDVEIRMNTAPDPIPLIDLALVEGLLTRLEEVRPIHVLLRTFAIVTELADDMDPVATDAHAPLRHAWYEFDGVQKHFLLDAGTLADDDVLMLEQIGASHDVTLQLDENAPIVSILDHAVIDAGGTIFHV